MSVTLLSRHVEARKAAPAVVVERITEGTFRRWQIEAGAKCTFYPYGFKCTDDAQFLVRPLGAKNAHASCSSCLSKRCKKMLERPAGEAEKIEAEKIERLRLNKAITDARKAHAEARLCEAYSRKTLSGLCERSPKFLVETYNGERDERLCAHHTAPWRKKLVTEYAKEAMADGTTLVRYNHNAERRLRRIAPILTALTEKPISESTTLEEKP